MKRFSIWLPTLTFIAITISLLGCNSYRSRSTDLSGRAASEASGHHLTATCIPTDGHSCQFVIPDPNVVSHLKILPMGDSNTNGDVFPPGGSFRVPLWTLFNNVGMNVTFVGAQVNGPGYNADAGTITPNVPPFGSHHHEGWDGFTIAQLNFQMNAFQSVAEFAPDIVTIQVGTNDVTQGGYSQSTSIATYTTLLDADIAGCANISTVYGSCWVLVTSVPHVANGDANDVKIKSLNIAIQALTVTRPRTVWIDLYAAISGDPNNFALGHVDAAGQAIWAQLYFDAINKLGH